MFGKKCEFREILTNGTNHQLSISNDDPLESEFEGVRLGSKEAAYVQEQRETFGEKCNQQDRSIPRPG